MCKKAKFVKLRPDAVIPRYQTKKSAGCDLTIPTEMQAIELQPGELKLVATGIVAIPPYGYHWELCLRSSTPVKNRGLVQANSIGIIDSDFCGSKDEIKIPVLNTGDELITLKPGTRIAQLVLRENLCPDIKEITFEELKQTSRGGFGSTGE